MSSTSTKSILSYCLCTSVISLFTIQQISNVIYLTDEGFLISILLMIFFVELSNTVLIFSYNALTIQQQEKLSIYAGPILICSAVLNVTVSLVMLFFIVKVGLDSKSLHNIMVMGYGSPFYPKIQKSWDHIQHNGKCCGIYNFTDWQQSTWFNRQNSYPPAIVPSSCTDDQGKIYNDGCYSNIRNKTFLFGTLFSVFAIWTAIKKVKMCKNLLDNTQRIRIQNNVMDNINVY